MGHPDDIQKKYAEMCAYSFIFEGNGSGLWLPTPSSISYGSNQGEGMGRVGPVRHSLESMARHDMWPTPQHRDGTPRGAQAKRYLNPDRSNDLPDAVKLWPTPTKNANADCPSERRRNTPALSSAVTSTDADMMVCGCGYEFPENLGKYRCPNCLGEYEGRSKPAGSLNPDWVEWLMGWPIGWESLDPLEDATILPFHPEPDIPRVATGTKDRASRLKALGNGQVPLCAAMAWRLLK